uniref:Ig-like domain-containing protein n=1 Tax=Denticeps clupeoides TaxID=299321 RepID=A0AAY4AIT3_9TELE
DVVQTPPEILVSPENPVKLTCSHNSSRFDMIQWYQKSPSSTAIKLIGYVRFNSPTIEDSFTGHFSITGDGSKESVLHFVKLSLGEDTGVYYCTAKRRRENYLFLCDDLAPWGQGATKEIRGPVVEVLPPSEAELCKKKKKDNVTLLCVAKNFYPDHVYVSWEIDNDVKREKTKDVPIEKDGNYIISSRLRVPKKDWKSGKKFTCINCKNNNNKRRILQ